MKKMNELHLTENQVHKIITEHQEMNRLSFTMLLNRLRRKYKLNYNSDTLQECTKEVNIFLNKYKHAMAQDYFYLIEAYTEGLLAA